MVFFCPNDKNKGDMSVSPFVFILVELFVNALKASIIGLSSILDVGIELTIQFVFNPGRLHQCTKTHDKKRTS